MPAVDPIPCQQGYHVCTIGQAIQWIGSSAWLAEVEGEVIDHDVKTVAERARLIRRLNWDVRVARHFAADCAERVLPIYEHRYPADERPRRAIEAARMFADGKIDAAARAAAGDAARAAARAAAWDAARAAAWDAAGDAARAAAGAAAWDAAWAAAWDAAGDAERRWQAEHLAEVLGVD
jgi:hypothetical protein